LKIALQGGSGVVGRRLTESLGPEPEFVDLPLADLVVIATPLEAAEDAYHKARTAAPAARVLDMTGYLKDAGLAVHLLHCRLTGIAFPDGLPVATPACFAAAVAVPVFYLNRVLSFAPRRLMAHGLGGRTVVGTSGDVPSHHARFASPDGTGHHAREAFFYTGCPVTVSICVADIDSGILATTYMELDQREIAENGPAPPLVPPEGCVRYRGIEGDFRPEADMPPLRSLLGTGDCVFRFRPVGPELIEIQAALDNIEFPVQFAVDYVRYLEESRHARRPAAR
jgi:hypothetical protein